MERGRTLAARIMNPSLLKQQASERANSDAPSAEDASPTVLPIVGIALVVEGEPPGIILRRVVAQRGFDVAIGNIAAAVRVFCVCYNMVTVYISSFHFIFKLCYHAAISKIASISTQTPRGRAFVPSAARECEPRSSPNTWSNKSDAPLPTKG